jgi:hypothetical protein
VYLNRDALPIIVDTNKTLSWINLNLQNIHFSVSLVVVSSIHEDLVKYFVKGWNICNILIGKFEVVFPKDPFA